MWRTDGTESSIGYLWGVLDWISRLDILLLALTLIYIFILVGRASYRHWDGARNPDPRPIDDLSRAIDALKSIVLAAPYLGLAGTCFGILESFRGIGMQKAAAMAMTVTYIEAALLTTASGLIVAFSAATSYNYLSWLRGRLDRETNSGGVDWGRSKGRWPSWGSPISSRFPAAGLFSKLPAFALVAAPAMAFAMAAFLTLPTFKPPMGLGVGLLRPGASRPQADPAIQPIYIGLSQLSPYLEGDIYVNSKKTPLDDLDRALFTELKAHEGTAIYVEAESGVSWNYILEVIDILSQRSSEVVLLGTSPGCSLDETRALGPSMK